MVVLNPLDLLRSPNNAMTDMVIMQVLKKSINMNTSGIYNTNLALTSESGTGDERVYIQNKYMMSQGPFPAVHLEAGEQNYHRNSLRTYAGMTVIDLEYYDRWDTQPNTIDSIRAGIAADLERIKANIEENDSLSYGGQAYAISIPDMKLSPYKGEFDTQFPGMTLVYRQLTLIMNLLPYGV